LLKLFPDGQFRARFPLLHHLLSGLLLRLIRTWLLRVLIFLLLNLLKISLQALFLILVLIDELLGDVIFVTYFAHRMASGSFCSTNFKV